MREAEERKVWANLRGKANSTPSQMVEVHKASLDLAQPCIVLGGRNGVGKSRVLRGLATQLGPKARYVDLHYIAQRILQATRHRTDLAEMLNEYDPIDLDDSRLEDVVKVVGRAYDALAWYELEVDTAEPGETTPDELWWLASEQMPYFTAKFRGQAYASSDMGLGEFGVHLLFWYLSHWAGDDSVKYLLLDEPDAYLPPIAAQSLIRRLLGLCLRHGWSLIISTHSQSVIEESAAEQAFVRLEIDSAGGILSTHVRDVPAAADDLLADPPVRRIFFVEDESAYHLSRALLRSVDRRAERSTMLVWKDGYGYMKAMRGALPRFPDEQISFAYIFDGDKRAELGPSSEDQWPSLYLPTAGDPDDLFVTVGAEIGHLAVRLNTDEQELRWILGGLSGTDPHDWVNKLAEKYERSHVLRALADLWVELNPREAEEFCEELRALL